MLGFVPAPVAQTDTKQQLKRSIALPCAHTRWPPVLKRRRKGSKAKIDQRGTEAEPDGGSASVLPICFLRYLQKCKLNIKNRDNIIHARGSANTSLLSQIKAQRKQSGLLLMHLYGWSWVNLHSQLKYTNKSDRNVKLRRSQSHGRPKSDNWHNISKYKQHSTAPKKICSTTSL